MGLLGIILLVFMASCSDRAQGEEPERIEERIEPPSEEIKSDEVAPLPTITLLVWTDI